MSEWERVKTITRVPMFQRDLGSLTATVERRPDYTFCATITVDVPDDWRTIEVCATGGHEDEASACRAADKVLAAIAAFQGSTS